MQYKHNYENDFYEKSGQYKIVHSWRPERSVYRGYNLPELRALDSKDDPYGFLGDN